MARKRRRSSFRGLVQVPGLGFLNAYKGSVSVMDVGVGLLAGMAGTAGLKWVINKLNASSPGAVPEVVAKALPALGGVATGVALYYVEKKSARAKGHLVGASLAGLGLASWDLIKKQFPTLGLSDLVMVPGLGWAYNGVIVDNPAAHLNAYNGVIVDNPASHLNDLAASAMGDSGMEFMAAA